MLGVYLQLLQKSGVVAMMMTVFRGGLLELMSSGDILLSGTLLQDVRKSIKQGPHTRQQALLNLVGGGRPFSQIYWPAGGPRAGCWAGRQAGRQSGRQVGGLGVQLVGRQGDWGHYPFIVVAGRRTHCENASGMWLPKFRQK